MQSRTTFQYGFDLVRLVVGARISAGVRAILALSLSLSISLCSAQSAHAPQPPAAEKAEKEIPLLEAGHAVEHELSGKTFDTYQLALKTGEFAAITVEQRGLDVVVQVADPSGKNLADFDSESLPRGQEHVCVFAEVEGRYKITVKPRYARAAAGRYQIQIDAVRSATERGKLLFEARKLSTQAQQINDRGRFADARPIAAQALETGQKALAPDDPYIAELLVRSAELERLTDNRAKAIDLFNRAIAIDEAALGHDNPQTANARQRLGVLYVWADDTVKAEPLLQGALDSLEKSLGNEHPRVVTAITNLAMVSQNRLDTDLALKQLQQAQGIAVKVMDPDEFSRIAVTNNLANLYREARDYDRAQPLFEEVLSILEKKYGPDYVRLSEPLMNLGIIAREKKQYDRSLEYLWRSQSIREKAIGPENSENARTLITIGNTYRAQGDYPKSLEIYERARNLLKNVVGPYDNNMLLTYVNAAVAYAAMGDVPHAVEYETISDTRLEQIIGLNLAIGSERQKFEFLNAAYERTDRTISLSAVQAPDNKAATDLAALIVLQRKGRVLDAVSGSMATLRERLTSEDQALLDQLNKTTSDLSTLALNGAGKNSPEEFQKQLAALEDQHEKLEAKISSRNTEFRLQAQTVTLAAVQSAIPPHAALIELITYHPFDPKIDNKTAYGPPHYIAYVLTPQSVQWKELGPTQNIDDVIAAFRRSLRDPESKDIKQASRALDQLVMQPIRPLLGDASQLLISPDGQLNLIPFEALLDDHGQFLLERYSISYLTAGRDLLRLQAERPSKHNPVIVADPSFGEPGTVVASAAPAKLKKAVPTAARRSVTTAGDLSSVYFAPLEGTAVEARAIRSLFPDSKVLTGSNATQDAVMHIDAPIILHIATHGFFLTNPGDPAKPASNDPRGIKQTSSIANPLLRSGLALTGANIKHGEEKDDGILTALEASNLNLWGTKLVTLSACDTGVGDIRNGEGVYGLRRAFVLAGAESVVMSLWPVSDYVTREMMTSYYAGLKKGLGRSEALRETKLAMLKHKGRQHPFYWASFIQSGEWANLNGQR